MNSSMACAYDSCELVAASEFRTAFFDCSKSGKRSIVFARERFLSFSDVPYWRPPAPRSVLVIHSEADGLEPRFRTVRGRCPVMPPDKTSMTSTIGGGK